VIALSSVSRKEHLHWQDAAAREGERYGVDPEYTSSRIAGEDVGSAQRRRTWVDAAVVIVATAIIVGFALVARAPQISLNWGWALALVAASVAIVAATGSALWKTTRFN
jgi:hypothetical protein